MELKDIERFNIFRPVKVLITASKDKRMLPVEHLSRLEVVRFMGYLERTYPDALIYAKLDGGMVESRKWLESQYGIS